MNPNLLNRYPSIHDLRARTRSRIPHFAWEYLDSGTGVERAVAENERAFQEITLMPRFLAGDIAPSLKTELFGTQYNYPFGIAPVGLTGLMWPGIEKMLARTAAQYGIPYCLSTVATESPEVIGPITGDMGWFQLYPPNDPDMRKDILSRAKAAGMKTLVITVDTPRQSRRERQLRAEVSVPPKKTLKTYWRAAVRPAWTMATLQHGLPRFRTLEKYVGSTDISLVGLYLNENMGTIDWEYLDETRAEWDGPMLVKGILSPLDAEKAISLGAEGVIVSNHGGRQFDGAPATIHALPEIVRAVGNRGVVILDSGIRGGLDICRALALGADFVMLGRAFIYGAAAHGQPGVNHVVDLLDADLDSNLANIGCHDLKQLPDHLIV